MLNKEDIHGSEWWMSRNASKQGRFNNGSCWMPENGNGRAMHVTIESHFVPLLGRLMI